VGEWSGKDKAFGPLTEEKGSCCKKGVTNQDAAFAPYALTLRSHQVRVRSHSAGLRSRSEAVRRAGKAGLHSTNHPKLPQVEN